MKREDYEKIEDQMGKMFVPNSSLTLILDALKSLVEEPANPTCTTPESDKPVKDPDLMFTCLEYAHEICLESTPDEVLAFAKRIYEWVK